MTERRFRRDLSSLQFIFAFVRECFRAGGLDEEAAWDVDLILEELFTNMLRYSAGAADVAIAMDWTPPILTLRLRDYGVEPFDVTRAAPFDVDLPLEARRAGGMGLHLVRCMSDRLDYEHAGGTSTITVIKRLA